MSRVSRPLPSGAVRIEGYVFDANGNPMAESDGCPNCGKDSGWVDAVTAHFFGEQVCSRACRFQLEYAAERPSIAFAHKHAAARCVLGYLAWMELCVRFSTIAGDVEYGSGSAAEGVQ